MLKKYLIVFFVSMVPIIELRGAIPYAVGFGLPLLPSYIIAIIGNMIPVPFIFLFARKVLVWGSTKKYIGKFFTWCLKKGEKGGEKLKQSAGKGLYIALLIFVPAVTKVFTTSSILPAPLKKFSKADLAPTGT